MSCFIEPTLKSVRLSHELGADAVEFHTGQYCLATQTVLGPDTKKVTSKKTQGRNQNKIQNKIQDELERLHEAALEGVKLGIHLHAGHGLDSENVRPVAAWERPNSFDSSHSSDSKNRLPLIEEYNIGHAIVCRAALVGLQRAVREMVSAILAP